MVRGAQRDEPADLLPAFEAADRAVRLDGSSPEGRLNRA
jgi:hypothetical protein